MKKINTLISTIALSFIAPQSLADNSYDIYLVRHAEKQKTSDNPHLTQCGRFRAKQLAQTLRNVDIKSVYSTSYNRTLETATPTASSKKLGVKQYSPSGLPQLARQIKQNKESVLIVGHSNTTPELASILLGSTVTKMNEDEYQHLFQIQMSDDKVKLVKLTQPLNCELIK